MFPLRLLTACLASVAVAVAGCSALPGAQPPARGAASDPPTGAAQRPPRPSCSARVLAGMTQPQRVGQLFLVGLTNDTLSRAEAATITSHHFGSVLFVTNTAVGAARVRTVSSAVQALVSRQATAGVGFLVAANQEGGQVQALKGRGFATIPTALAQGRLSPPVLQEMARGWGRQLRAAGVNMDLAPVMGVVPRADVSLNQALGVYQREYGNTPAVAAAHGAAFIRGMQAAGVATTAKHFPGLGLVRGNTDFTANVVDRVTTADSPYLRSFQGAIDAGVPFMMISLATYARIDPHHLAVFSPVIMRQVLRGQMGFRGVILSDDLGPTRAVAGIPVAARALRFLSAGGDMITSSTVPAAVTMYRAVLHRSRTDPAFRRLVDSAAAVVLAAKQAAGLLPCG